MLRGSALPGLCQRFEHGVHAAPKMTGPTLKSALGEETAMDLRGRRIAQGAFAHLLCQSISDRVAAPPST